MDALVKKLVNVEAIRYAIDNRSLADNTHLFPTIVEILGVAEVARHVCNIFQVNALKKRYNEIHYHDWFHIIVTTLNAVEGCVINKVSDSEMRCCVIAALHHDVNHSVGIDTDNVNIKAALNTFKNSCEVLECLENITEQEISLVKECIRATEFPWKKYSKLSTCSKILRDADLMGVYLKDNEALATLFTGLYNEGKYTYTSMEHFLSAQEKFRVMVKWNTRWASTKAVTSNWPAQFIRMSKLMRSQLA